METKRYSGAEMVRKEGKECETHYLFDSRVRREKNKNFVHIRGKIGSFSGYFSGDHSTSYRSIVLALAFYFEPRKKID